MKGVVLAAGFGTRFEAGLSTLDDRLQEELTPIVQQSGKCLLPLGGVPALSLWVSELKKWGDIEEIVIVTNNKYFAAFQQWHATESFDNSVVIINNGKNDVKEKNGAI